MTTAIIEAGTLTASLADRVVSGLLLPFNEVGRTNLGRFSIPPGTIDVPADASVMVLNDKHDQAAPLGHGLTLTATDAGIVASFRVGKTPEGDAYLADVDAGRRNALSAEVADVVIRSGKAISGRLFAAAAVTAGAFPSATLMATDVGDPDPAPSTGSVVIDGVEYVRKTTTAEPAPATEPGTEPAKEDTMTTTTTEPDTTGTLAATDPTAAGLPTSLQPTTTRPRTSGHQYEHAGDLFAALAAHHTRGGSPGQLLAALDNAIQADVQPTQQPSWLGEVWASRTYQPRYAPLLTPGTLSALKATGWKFTTGKTPTVATYAGFPAQPASTEVKTEAVTVNASRIAGAGAIDRAFVDFSTPEFWAGYYRECANDYARKLDAAVLAHLLTSTNYTEVEGGTVPTGVSTAAAYIVDGASSILDVAVPSFAIVGSDLYREFLLTKSNDALEYLSIALGIEDGSLNNFKVVPSSDAGLTGKVLVGAKSAATVFQLPGSPVRIDTVNVATGGVETGVFGYHAEFTASASAFALVAEAAG